MHRSYFFARVRSAAVVVACLAFSACAGLAGLDKAPRVTLVNIKPLEFHLLEQRYLATVRIQNPNDVELAIHGMEYQITVNDKAFANGVSNEPLIVPAYGEKTVDVGATSTIVKLLDQLRRFSDADGVLRYGISGTLGVSGVPGGLGFSQEGELDLTPERAPSGQSASLALD